MKEYERRIRHKMKPDYELGFWFLIWTKIYFFFFCDTEEYYVLKGEKK